nr:hypothetical protein CFP56_64797 [Quercus suber]
MWLPLASIRHPTTVSSLAIEEKSMNHQHHQIIGTGAGTFFPLFRFRFVVRLRYIGTTGTERQAVYP